MKVCQRCNTRLDDRVNACPKCGSSSFISVEQARQMSQQQGNQNMQRQQQQRPQQQRQQQQMQQSNQFNAGVQQRQMQAGNAMQPRQQARPQARPVQPANRPNNMRPVQPNVQQNNQFMDDDFSFDPNLQPEEPKKKGLNFGKKKAEQQQNNNSLEFNDTNGNINTGIKMEPVVSVLDWIILQVQLLIPIWNIVVIIKTLVGKKESTTKKNYIITYLIFAIIGLILGIVLSKTLAATIVSMIQ